jgi:hypothetical protein
VQSGTPGASQQQTPRPAPTATAGQITVTGCVTREVAGQLALSNAMTPAAGATARTETGGAVAGSTGTSSRDGSAAATAGTSGTASAGANAGVGAGGAAAQSPRTSASGNTMNYSLAGDRENELEKYVGQRVEIVGTVDGASAAATAGASSPGSSSSTGAAGSAGAGSDAARPPVTRPEGSTSSGADANRGGAPAASGHAQRLNIVSFRPVGGECS